MRGRVREIKPRDPAAAERSRTYAHLSVTAIAVLLQVVLFQFDFDGFRGTLVDLFFRTQFWSSPHPDIRLVAFDEASSRFYNGTTRLPAIEIAQVFAQLAEEKPKAVVLLATLSERYYGEAELQLLARSFEKLPVAYAGYIDDESLGKTQPAQLQLAGRYLPGFVSRDTFSYGADSVSRRVMLSIDGFPTVYAAAACRARGLEAPELCLKGRGIEKIGDAIQGYVNWQGRAGTYTPVSTRTVATGGMPKGSFTGKIVLIGTALKANRSTDFVRTPYTHNPRETTQLEGAAHALATLLSGTQIAKSSSLLNWILTLIVGLCTVNLVLFLPPGRGILLVVGEVAALFVIGWLGLFAFHYWLDIAHPFLVACIAYYVVIPYRLVDEYRKRYHYQEKSELMTQLELLKSNFLSLVSHDLKTPIARIQGTAELLLNDGNDPEKRRKSLTAIMRTTEDMGEYVETVLDVVRAESATMPLRKTSRDVNKLIQEIIDQKGYLAAEKRIHIEASLEPLFSIKFDEKLIRRVLANLVENAIKYSPPDTTIRLSSKEDRDWVTIAVEDQGVGISAEDQPMVFTKFYRCKNSEAEQKGNGLGLYLVKYFVELHDGFVELKSELGKGSVFTVGLPV